MPAWPVPAVEPCDVEGSPVFGAFGHMNSSKRIPQLLRAFGRFRASHAGARLLLVGSVAPELDLEWRIDHAGLVDAVVREDWVSEERLWSLVERVDAVVSLRSPTMGETSAMVVRALTLGKPVVVSDVGRSPSCRTASRSRSRRTSARSTGSSPRWRCSSSPAYARPWARRRASAHRVSMISSTLRISTRRCSRRTDRVTLCRTSRATSARWADVRRASCSGLGVGGQRRRRLGRRSLLARAPDGRAVDHGRRADLLGAREELRRGRPVPDPGRPGRRRTESSIPR